MSLLNTLDVAVSGVYAQGLRLNNIASNLSNAQSLASDPDQTYRARRVVLQTGDEKFGDVFGNLTDKSGLGVKVSDIYESQEPLQKRFEPNSPYADEQGYVHLPNVNIAEELTHMMSASHGYQLGLEIINTTKQLAMQTAQVGQ